MAKYHNFLGIIAAHIGEPGDGVMGTTLTEFNDIEVGSVTIEGANANEENIPSEANDTYITVDGTVDPTSITLRLYGVSPEQRVELMGGRVGTAADNEDEGNYMAPAAKPSLYKSFKAVGKTIDGKRGVFKIPYGKLNAREQGNITKNGLPAVDITITANTPESAAGEEGSPYILGWEDVV